MPVPYRTYSPMCLCSSNDSGVACWYCMVLHNLHVTCPVPVSASAALVRLQAIHLGFQGRFHYPCLLVTEGHSSDMCARVTGLSMRASALPDLCSHPQHIWSDHRRSDHIWSDQPGCAAVFAVKKPAVCPVKKPAPSASIMLWRQLTHHLRRQDYFALHDSNQDSRLAKASRVCPVCFAGQSEETGAGSYEPGGSACRQARQTYHRRVSAVPLSGLKLNVSQLQNRCDSACLVQTQH